MGVNLEIFLSRGVGKHYKGEKSMGDSLCLLYVWSWLRGYMLIVHNRFLMVIITVLVSSITSAM